MRTIVFAILSLTYCLAAHAVPQTAKNHVSMNHSMALGNAPPGNRPPQSFSPPTPTGSNPPASTPDATSPPNASQADPSSMVTPKDAYGNDAGPPQPAPPPPMSASGTNAVLAVVSSKHLEYDRDLMSLQPDAPHKTHKRPVRHK